MGFLSSRSRITKEVGALLIIVAASTTIVIGYYEATHVTSPSVSPTPSPSLQREFSAEPTYISSATIEPTSIPSQKPEQSPTPTSSALSTATPTSSPTPTAVPTPTPTQYPTWTPTPTSGPSPAEQTSQERVRDSIMSFIKTNHPETGQFMTDLVWTGGRMTPPNLLGYETYIYYSHGWNVTIGYPVVLNPIYKIVADYSAVGISIPYRVIWNGTWQNESINETSYTFAQ